MWRSRIRGSLSKSEQEFWVFYKSPGGRGPNREVGAEVFFRLGNRVRMSNVNFAT